MSDYPNTPLPPPNPDYMISGSGQHQRRSSSFRGDQAPYPTSEPHSAYQPPYPTSDALPTRTNPSAFQSPRPALPPQFMSDYAVTGSPSDPMSPQNQIGRRRSHSYGAYTDLAPPPRPPPTTARYSTTSIQGIPVSMQPQSRPDQQLVPQHHYSSSAPQQSIYFPPPPTSSQAESSLSPWTRRRPSYIEAQQQMQQRRPSSSSAVAGRRSSSFRRQSHDFHEIRNDDSDGDDDLDGSEDDERRRRRRERRRSSQGRRKWSVDETERATLGESLDMMAGWVKDLMPAHRRV